MITTLAGALDRVFQSHKGQNEKPKIKNKNCGIAAERQRIP
jgi:hypothetical protein